MRRGLAGASAHCFASPPSRTTNAASSPEAPRGGRPSRPSFLCSPACGSSTRPPSCTCTPTRQPTPTSAGFTSRSGASRPTLLKLWPRTSQSTCSCARRWSRRKADAAHPMRSDRRPTRRGPQQRLWSLLPMTALYDRWGLLDAATRAMRVSARSRRTRFRTRRAHPAHARTGDVMRK